MQGGSASVWATTSASYTDTTTTTNNNNDNHDYDDTSLNGFAPIWGALSPHATTGGEAPGAAGNPPRAFALRDPVAGKLAALFAIQLNNC